MNTLTINVIDGSGVTEKNITQDDFVAILKDYYSRYSKWDVVVLKNGILSLEQRNATFFSLVGNAKASAGDYQYETIQLKFEGGDLLLIDSFGIKLDWESIFKIRIYEDRISIFCHSPGKTVEEIESVVFELFGHE